MPACDFMILAEHAVVDDGKLSLLHGGLTGISPSELPAQVGPLYVAFRLRIETTEKNRQFQVEIDFLKPNGESVYGRPFFGGMTPGFAVGDRADIPDFLQTSAPLPTTMVSDEGKYAFVLRADGNELNTLPFYIYLKKQDEESQGG